MSTINPDEVIAIGAAKQASLLPEDCDDKSELNENVGLRALNYDIVFTSVSDLDETSTGNESSSQPEVTVLIPSNCPIPVRPSHYFPTGNDSICVKVFLRNQNNQELKELVELKLTELEKQDAKQPSLSAHIHRDGGIHIALTEKGTNKCDQLTLPAPTPTSPNSS